MAEAEEEVVAPEEDPVETTPARDIRAPVKPFPPAPVKPFPSAPVAPPKLNPMLPYAQGGKPKSSAEFGPGPAGLAAYNKAIAAWNAKQTRYDNALREFMRKDFIWKKYIEELKAWEAEKAKPAPAKGAPGPVGPTGTMAEEWNNDMIQERLAGVRRGIQDDLKRIAPLRSQSEQEAKPFVQKQSFPVEEWNNDVLQERIAGVMSGIQDDLRRITPLRSPAEQEANPFIPARALPSQYDDMFAKQNAENQMSVLQTQWEVDRQAKFRTALAEELARMGR